MDWILLILIQNAPVNDQANIYRALPQNMGFKTQTGCENAATDIKKFVGPDVVIRTTCVKR